MAAKKKVDVKTARRQARLDRGPRRIPQSFVVNPKDPAKAEPPAEEPAPK